MINTYTIQDQLKLVYSTFYLTQRQVRLRRFEHIL
jgi:hypothetical protein